MKSVRIGVMPENNNQSQISPVLSSSFSLIICLALFLGGIALLALRIPGWSLFLGLPATQIGIVFLIFTLDDIAKNRVGPNSLRIIKCSVCGRPTLAPKGQRQDICEECQKKIISS